MQAKPSRIPKQRGSVQASRSIHRSAAAFPHSPELSVAGWLFFFFFFCCCLLVHVRSFCGMLVAKANGKATRMSQSGFIYLFYLAWQLTIGLSEIVHFRNHVPDLIVV
jgi:hypothetical protein